MEHMASAFRVVVPSMRLQEITLRYCPERSAIECRDSDGVVKFSLSVGNITDIYEGKQTKGFDLCSDAAEVPECLCLSLESPGFSLDLVAPSQEERRMWLRGIESLVQG